MLPPTHVYSLIIHNKTSKEMTVMVTYSNMIDNTLAQHSVVVAAGEKGVAEQRTFAWNGATFAVVITAVDVKDAQTALTAPFPGVDSPTSDYLITIVEESGTVHLKAGQP
ncbi:hypothetical protein conserved [Leishmania donovani]|uniref:Uncharacterized protein n=3 Tax=Leishmania donovani species complex TaxID=38574 RepID=A4I5V4_LEIIN|nr:conserved hypothetical protein [Leishmania infantum JPCM5]XP_003862988.1 hypothetical protein, conserved [Leishmania donovani]CAC9515128.1 hypothetical_protein_-_conserved [Leishmania infantum]AYU81077.1 hypothetical protein LdCL_300033300 [Leishmania donovani]CAJ1991069.1 hypothetical protein conserved [Leishmania donovani]CAM70176.1 conserved hypothetical protein [Leishmania infantum JPCM5]CBZ36298.1 hypothetical protein, conserved [Leishmania donovani]|eukprot:XP_001467123.1 conserved hypothetical protein [Leishmania infantum JPCM5]